MTPAGKSGAFVHDPGTVEGLTRLKAWLPGGWLDMTMLFAGVLGEQ
jgi:hypothetical protein